VTRLESVISCLVGRRSKNWTRNPRFYKVKVEIITIIATGRKIWGTENRTPSLNYERRT